MTATDDRLARILRLLSSDDATAGTDRLCAVCAEATNVSGAGIMLMSSDVPQGSLCTTDQVSALIEELQYTLGEGPCVDAYQTHRPVAAPALAASEEVRWPAFTPAVVAAGAGALFGFPLGIGAIRLGALNLYRDRPGPLTPDQHSDALVMANVAARVVIGMQANAPLGTIAVELERGADFQLVVHQAAGMVAVQLDVNVTEALVRLRARAFADERRLADVATAVVERRLRFDDHAGEARS